MFNLDDIQLAQITNLGRLESNNSNENSFRGKVSFSIDFLVESVLVRSKGKKKKGKGRKKDDELGRTRLFRGVRDMVRGDGQIGGCLRGWSSVWVMRDFEVVGERTGV